MDTAAPRIGLPLLRGGLDEDGPWLALCGECPFSKDGLPNKPVLSEHPEDPAWLIIGEGPGHNEVRFDKPFCLTPDTPVLMADLSWRSIGELVAGDKILAVDEESGKGWGASGRRSRRWHVATVTATHRRVAETLEIQTERGTLRGSADHPVLVRKGGNHKGSSGGTRWLELGKLQTSAHRGPLSRTSRIVFVGEPWAQRLDYDAAWMAGFLDGEGHVNGSRPDQRRSIRGRKSRGDAKVGFSQNAGPVFDRAIEALRRLGYEPNAKEEHRAKGVVCNRVTIRGDLATTMRFLGEIRPERLITNFQTAVEDKGIRGVTAARVLSRKSIGEHELVDITTTTGTFIANGFVVHNCGASGQVVNKALARIGRARETLYVGNATLCIPFMGATEQDRQLAATCCKPRMLAELAQFPGRPILTFGAVAARSVIPQAVLDTIDPPDTPRAIKKAQKMRSSPELKNRVARRKAVAKEAQRRLKKMIDYRRRQLIIEAKVKYRKRPDARYLETEIARGQAKMQLKAQEDAIKSVDLKIKERVARALAKSQQKTTKPKKKKPIKITDIVGTLFDVDVDGSGVRPVIPAIHPAALLRGGGASIAGSHAPDMAFINIIFDAMKVDSLAKGRDIRLRLNTQIETENFERAVELFLAVYRDAIDEGALSIDLETYVDDPDKHHALMAYMARVKVIGFATKRMAVSLSWELLPDWCRSMMQLLLGSVETTYHNGLYDRTVLRNQFHGFVIAEADLWFDTLLAHHAAFPGNSHRLQVVTSQFYGVGPWKSEYRNQEETPATLALYNAKDTGGTHALRAPLQLWLKKSKTERVFDLDKKMSDIASHMHLKGMPVDREINSELSKTFTKAVKDSRHAVEDIARDPKLRDQIWHHLSIQQARKQRKLDPSDFEERYQIRLSAMQLDPDWRWKIGSGKHISALLLAMGVPLIERTTGGDVSTKKDVLEALVDVPIVRDILLFRENDKLLSTFVTPIFDRFDELGNIVQHGFADGNDRIHPIWNVHRISGRWASQWPVVSNVPKDKWKKLIGDLLLIVFGIQLPEKGALTLPDGTIVRVNKDKSVSRMVRPNLRRQIRAPHGRVLVGFDFEQIEARVIALISGDPFLCAIFAEGRDPHIECARIIWPHFDTLDPDTRKQLRENVKNIEYGAMYMAQLDTLHQTMLKAGNLIDKKDLAIALGKLLRAMAGVVKWQHDTVIRASVPPYEISDFVLGRRRVWPLGQVEGPEAVNYGVQTAAASIMNTGMAQMMPRLEKYQEAYAIAQIHDAAVFECWEHDAPALERDITEAYTQAYERDGRHIPFGVQVRTGQDWASV